MTVNDLGEIIIRILQIKELARRLLRNNHMRLEDIWISEIAEAFAILQNYHLVRVVLS